MSKYDEIRKELRGVSAILSRLRLAVATAKRTADKERPLGWSPEQHISRALHYALTSLSNVDSDICQLSVWMDDMNLK
ncbi:MAG: hypothetical protein J6S05_07775 [Bacteroidaceae bacterium]|nr:hypothetical protein [Bacteroidaceae bacterium]MBO5785301.1 hypothetical protein [Bacteroidaceae bacterium]